MNKFINIIERKSPIWINSTKQATLGNITPIISWVPHKVSDPSSILTTITSLIIKLKPINILTTKKPRKIKNPSTPTPFRRRSKYSLTSYSIIKTTAKTSVDPYKHPIEKIQTKVRPNSMKHQGDSHWRRIGRKANKNLDSKAAVQRMLNWKHRLSFRKDLKHRKERDRQQQPAKIEFMMWSNAKQVRMTRKSILILRFQINGQIETSHRAMQRETKAISFPLKLPSTLSFYLYLQIDLI